MRIAIIDDHGDDRALLAEILKEALPAKGVVLDGISEFESGGSFLAVYEHGCFDIVFLDIYMALPRPLLKRFYDELGFYSCPVSNFEQYTLARFIEDGYFEKHINRARKHYHDRNVLVRENKHSILDLLEKSLVRFQSAFDLTVISLADRMLDHDAADILGVHDIIDSLQHQKSHASSIRLHVA